MKGGGWHFKKEVESKNSAWSTRAKRNGPGEALWISSCRNKHPNAIYIQLALYI